MYGEQLFSVLLKNIEILFLALYLFISPGLRTSL